MNHTSKYSLLIAMTLFAGQLQAEEAKKEGILPKVDKPIPDTYEPLDGASWNHRTSEEIQTLREYQKQQKEEADAQRKLEMRQELEKKIQAPDPGAPTPAPEPRIIEGDNSLRIQDAQ